MPEAILDEISHRRFNPLRGSWVLVSPHRTKRPWQGQQEGASETILPLYDAACYLCPGNKRAQGDTNPEYKRTFVFVNDYSAVQEQQQEYSPDTIQDLSSQLLKAEAVTGKCYVLTFSPSHNVTLADMSPDEILFIIDAWTELYVSHLPSTSSLLPRAIQIDPSLESRFEDTSKSGSKTQYRYMQIFENKGAAMGCSNPHPHCQAWTTSTLPEELGLELEQLQTYRREHESRGLLQDYVELETTKKERVVFANKDFLVVCPWWATWPFETMIISVAHDRALTDLDSSRKQSLAEAIAEVTRRYDNLFETHFPYSMGIHQAPLQGTDEEIESSHFHIHFYPPLLRSATVRKFLVGYELLGEPQRDITPEQSAAKLRDCGGIVYRKWKFVD